MSITVYTKGEWSYHDWIDYSGMEPDMEFTMPDGRVLSDDEFAQELAWRADFGAIHHIDGWDSEQVGEPQSGSNAIDFAVLVEYGIPFELVELPDDEDDIEWIEPA